MSPFLPQAPARPPSFRLLLAVWLGAALVHAWYVAAWNERSGVVVPASSSIPAAAPAELYPLLARGFLRGQLSLDAEPPPELLQAANPYDPAQRPAVPYLHDASLHQGRYYLYFGPAPALLLFAPWRWLTGTDLPTAHAAGLLVATALLGLMCLWRRLVFQHYPEASRRTYLSGLIALGGASLLIALARRPGMYEVAIAGGVAAVAWGLHAALRAASSPHPARWGTATGLCFGLAVACRPSLALTAAGAAWLLRPGPRRREGRAALTAALIAGAAVVALVLAYNRARFGSVLEFGQGHQLSGIDEQAARHFHWSYLPYQAWLYLLAPLQVSSWFPFLRSPVPPPLPEGYWNTEHAFGLLVALPFLVWIPAGLWHARGRARGALEALLLAAAAAAAPLFLYFGATVRYQAEFTPWLVLLAAFGLAATEAGVLRRQRRLVRRLGLLTAAASATVVLLVAVDWYNPVSGGHPPAFDPLGRALNAPRRAWAAAHGQAAGPVGLEFTLNGPLDGGRDLLLVRGPDGSREVVSLEPAGPDRLKVRVRRTGPQPFDHAVDLDLVAGPQSLAVSSSTLLPVRTIELDEPMDRAALTSARGRLRLDWNGRRVLDVPVLPVDWQRPAALADATTLAAAGLRPLAGPVSVQRPTRLMTTPAPSRPRGVRLQAAWEGLAAGRSLPLATAGVPGSADFLFLRVEDGGTVRLGYEHWGKPLVLSPPLPRPAGATSRLEFWMPPFLSRDTAIPLVVAWDGEIRWIVDVPFFPSGAADLFIARNPVGGSYCEPEFPGVVVERTDLEPPAAIMPAATAP